MPFSSWRNENWNEHSLIRSSFSSLSSSHHRPISGSESHSAEGMWRELMQPFSVIEKQAVRAENEGEWCGGGEAIALAGIWTGEVILPLKCVEGFSQQVLTMRINRDQTKQSMQIKVRKQILQRNQVGLTAPTRDCSQLPVMSAVGDATFTSHMHISTPGLGSPSLAPPCSMLSSQFTHSLSLTSQCSPISEMFISSASSIVPLSTEQIPYVKHGRA